MTESDIQREAKRIAVAKNLLRSLGFEPSMANMQRRLSELHEEAKKRKAVR